MLMDREDGIILRGEIRRTRRKISYSARFSTTIPTWTDPGVNPVFLEERPVTNHLSHEMACEVIEFQMFVKRVDQCFKKVFKKLYIYATCTSGKLTP
jgi:hypothetical protein